MPLVGQAKLDYMRRRYRENPKPQIEYAQKYDAERRKSDPRAYRNIQLKRRYGITVDQYDSILESQFGMCALCGTKPARDVDHDHATGVMRELLCRPCNLGLGMFGDTEAGLMRAIEYLRKHKQET